MSKRVTTVAADGLRARVNGSYAKDKLDWLILYLTKGLGATQLKRTRVYVDLFAGPGVSVDKHTGEEFLSGALRSVQLSGDNREHTRFTDAYLVNLDENDHEALLARIDKLNAERMLTIARPNIRVMLGDANVLIHEIMREVHQLAWVFAFADIENVTQLPFTTLQAFRARGHESVDLYALFPLQISLIRRMTFDPAVAETLAPVVDSYFGTNAWREIYDYRKTSALSRESHRRLERLYCEQLQTLWVKADRVAKINFGHANRILYHMLFAASDPAALRIAEGVKKREERSKSISQRELFT